MKWPQNWAIQGFGIVACLSMFGKGGRINFLSFFYFQRNVVDVGSPRTITNINTPKDRRPTVQEAGQSELDAHKIAYLDDVEKLEARIVELENALKAINEKG